jgi:hypothetical protein
MIGRISELKDLNSKVRRLFTDPHGLIRIIRRTLAKWNPGILDPTGRKLKTRLLAVPLYRALGAIMPNLKNSEFSSFFGEHQYIFEWIAKNGKDFMIIDIGAGDGISKSNVAKSIHYYGLDSILVEGNGLKFSQLALNYQNHPNVSLIRSFINGKNVAGLVEGSSLNGAKYVLSLDIDSYDLDVVESILMINRPSLMCLEWNPLFKPQIEFTVTPNYTTGWRGDWFWGASIESWSQMLNRFDYGITTILGVSFFAEPKREGGEYLTSDEAYDMYLKQENRLLIPGETDGTRNFDNSEYIRNLLNEYPNYYTSSMTL